MQIGISVEQLLRQIFLDRRKPDVFVFRPENLHILITSSFLHRLVDLDTEVKYSDKFMK